ncbi:unnamed protein product [Gordionus sp. m RMFG-2023]|uniref:bifunctional purine biosynthesis protein ATIC-like n=1 Tax=Gordionus sp. m RMFG-2023 TaxID=3053472 RepID=UPI0030E0AB47
MQALISVYDKTALESLSRSLFSNGYEIIASGKTASFISSLNIPVKNISLYTGFTEILGGRVKTLHPAIHAGILARDNEMDQKELDKLNYHKIDLVICNLYPFSQVVREPDVAMDVAIENIDIGGITLIRAAAKNFERVTVLCDVKDYERVLDEIKTYKGKTTLQTRQELALKAFTCTADYDDKISDFFRKRFRDSTYQIDLRYGMNPSQKPAQIFSSNHELPFKVLNGAPGYINLLDALNSWQLVKELKGALNIPAAASFKHVSPAGVGIGVPFNEEDAKVFMVEDLLERLTPIAFAYARARGSDRMSSYGDFIALSDTCDFITAKIISREVSDGIIAPDFTQEALELLSRKKNDGYCILKMDPTYEPEVMERKILYGLTLEQPRNKTKIDKNFFSQIMSKNIELSDAALSDLIIATISLKFTQSNSVCYAKDGQTIGIGAGQQSRIHCTRLAGDKADNWWLRHHPKVLGLKFKEGTKRAEKINAIDAYITQEIENITDQQWCKVLKEIPQELTLHEKVEWNKKLNGVILSSDAFFPFRDSIDRAVNSGVEYIAAPSGSNNDKSVIDACNNYGITLVFTHERLFHH